MQEDTNKPEQLLQSSPARTNPAYSHDETWDETNGPIPMNNDQGKGGEGQEGQGQEGESIIHGSEPPGGFKPTGVEHTNGGGYELVVSGGRQLEEDDPHHNTATGGAGAGGSGSMSSGGDEATCSTVEQKGKGEQMGAEGEQMGADEEVEVQKARGGILGRALHWVYPTGFWRELKSLFFLSWPVVVTQILHYTIGTVAIIFGGHRGKLELDVIALSTSVLSVTAITVANGLAGYCDTLFAQVFGSEDKGQLGLVLQKCILVITLGLFPCLAVHVNLKQILLVMGHDYEVASLSEEYVLIFIPGTVGFFCYIVLSKYVQNQNKEIPIMVIAFMANILNIAMHSVLFVWLQKGVWGSALSQSVSYLSFFVMTSAYILVSGLYKDTWSGWSVDCLRSWGPYFKLGVYGLLQHCVEWWAFEAGIILTGSIGNLALAAQAIIYQFVLIFYTIAWGIGLGGGIRTGQFLGAMKPAAAKTSCTVTLTVAVIFGVVICILILALHKKLPYIFTSESDVVNLVASVFPIIAVEEIFDFLAGATNGILRGCGRQVVGMLITIPAFALVLFIGIPLMLKTSLQIKAFWAVVLITLFIQAVAGTAYLSRLDWHKESIAAQERIKISGSGQPVVLDEGTTNRIEENSSKSTCYGVPTRVILWRIFAFGLSIGVLLLGLFIRFALAHQGYGSHGNGVHRYQNDTMDIMGNSTLDMGYPLAMNITN